MSLSISCYNMLRSQYSIHSPLNFQKKKKSINTAFTTPHRTLFCLVLLNTAFYVCLYIRVCTVQRIPAEFSYYYSYTQQRLSSQTTLSSFTLKPQFGQLNMAVCIHVVCCCYCLCIFCILRDQAGRFSPPCPICICMYKQR